MFKSSKDLRAYVSENYPEVTDRRINESHWDLFCPTCAIARGFQVVESRVSGNQARGYGNFSRDFDAPVAYTFRCPVCKTFKQWIMYEMRIVEGGRTRSHFYKVASLPNDGIEDIEELPADPVSLRLAYKQAIRAMDANANIAAAAMFRRALQVITRQLLGATPGNLGNELRQVVGKPFNGGVVTNNFANVGYIVKEAGNQGAHPDGDPDLLDFTAEDAMDLQSIFMDVVSELFVIPAAKQKAKDDFLSRRKIRNAPQVVPPKVTS